jgi:chromosomal replication initiation ATPase DnaA
MAATSLSQPIVVTQVSAPGEVNHLTRRFCFEPVPGRITVRRVLELTAAHFGTTVAALTSRSRTQPLVRRRQIAYYAARRVTGRSLPLIARHIGDRDHTTIHWGVCRVQARIDAGDSEAIGAFEHIVANVTGGARG